MKWNLGLHLHCLWGGEMGVKYLFYCGQISFQVEAPSPVQPGLEPCQGWGTHSCSGWKCNVELQTFYQPRSLCACLRLRIAEYRQNKIEKKQKTEETQTADSSHRNLAHPFMLAFLSSWAMYPSPVLCVGGFVEENNCCLLLLFCSFQH